MKDFKIYGFIYDNPVMITNSKVISPASTFDETFSLQDHMRTTLTFKIMDKLSDGTKNPSMQFIYPAARIRLVMKTTRPSEEYQWPDNRVPPYNPELPKTIMKDIYYDHIITNISHEFHQDNTVYIVTCEDYASTIFSKEGVGLDLLVTGTITEVTEAILAATGKNLAYSGDSKNYLNFKHAVEHDTRAEIIGETAYKPSYTNAGFVTFLKPLDMEEGYYVLKGAGKNIQEDPN